MKYSKVYSHLRYIKIAALIIFSTIAGSSNTLAAEQPVRVAIAPFALNAPADMAYLQSGLQDMLESRLGQDENVTVIGEAETARALDGLQAPIDENEAREVGQRLSVDYVLFGSLTVFGSSVSLDARLVDVSGDEATRTFAQQSENIDGLVPKINTLAADINTSMVGAAVAAVPAAPAAPQTKTSDNVYDHPEKLAEGMTDPNVTKTESTAAAAPGAPSNEFWKSRRFKILMNGIALGDVDGDGKVETVVITPDSVIVYRNEGGSMFKTAEFKIGGFKILIGVDVADINANGVAEIFVTAQNTQKNRVYSEVYEYNGNTFAPIVEDSNYKYRVVEEPKGRPVLLGQKHVDKKPFAGAVFKMYWEAGDYQPGEQIGPGFGYSLMGWTYGNATNTHENSVVAYDDWDKLTLISSNGEVLWKHSDRTGGSTLQFSIGQIGPNEEGFQYLPMRILIADTDKDGKNEVIAVRNYDVASNALINFRKYNDAEFLALSWDGIGLYELWKTRKITGYMRDFAIGDFDNDGRDELVAALVLKEARIVGTTPSSTVIAYQFQ